MTFERHTFEVEIRDTTDHATDTAESDADATVVTNQLHPNSLQYATGVRMYLQNTHDQSFDVDVQHSATHTFDGAVNGGTVTLAADGGVDAVRLDGPFQAVRAVARTGALGTAPTTGSLRVTLVADT